MGSEIQDRVRESFSLMEDLLSRQIYSSQVYYNITGDYQYIAKMLRTLFLDFRGSIPSQHLAEVFAHNLEDLNQLRPLKQFAVDHDNMFFEAGLVPIGTDEVFLDCGAMDMSTSLEFAYNSKDTYKRIVAFEPDPVCQEICRDNLLFFSKEKRDCVKVFDCGVADFNGTAPFERATVLGNSRIAEKSEENIRVRRIDDIPECADATFLKVHVEGDEFRVLRGAERVIRANRPTIAVSCYHNLNELLEIPVFLKGLVPEYRLFMRHYSTGTSESVLYAVDRARLENS